MPHSSTKLSSEAVGLQRALRQWWWVMALCVALGAGAAYVSSKSQTPQYSASAKLLFRDFALGERLFPSAFSASQDVDRAAATNLQLAGLADVARRVASDRSLGMTANEVSRNIELKPQGNSDLVAVVATDPSPPRAAVLANHYATAFVTVRRDADRAKILEPARLLRSRLELLPPAERETAANRLQASRAGELETLAAVQTGNADVVEAATPSSSPMSPRPVRNGALGGIIGLLLGLGLALVLNRFDQRIRAVGEVEEILGTTNLVEIPKLRRASGGLASAESPALVLLSEASYDAVALERFRILRTMLRYFDPDRAAPQTLLVTSATSGEGKSTVSANLAQAAALDGSAVLLIQADLRRGAAHAPGSENYSGLGPLLAGIDSFDNAVVSLELPHDVVGYTGATLDVLRAGPVCPNPIQLLQTERMHELLALARERYDFIVIDTPPVNVVADALALVAHVSGVIIVTRPGLTRRSDLRDVRERLAGTSAPVLGSVINAAPRTSSSSSSYYTPEPRASDRLASLLKR